MGTHHLLLALLADEDSLAVRVLASFGVTTEAAEDRIDELGIEGTSDESPEEAGARGGLSGRLTLSSTGAAAEVRPLLASSAEEQAGSHPKASRACASFSVVVEREPAGEGLLVLPSVAGC